MRDIISAIYHHSLLKEVISIGQCLSFNRVCLTRFKSQTNVLCFIVRIMIMLNVLLVLCSIHPFVNGVGFRGFTYKGLEEPVSFKLNADIGITEGWITQPLDHFNYRDNRTWSMVIIIIHDYLSLIKMYHF